MKIEVYATNPLIINLGMAGMSGVGGAIPQHSEAARGAQEGSGPDVARTVTQVTDAGGPDGLLMVANRRHRCLNY
jgi:hypothetical protein